MDFKLSSKKNVGIILTLVFVILLCVSKFFNSMIDTYLGRVILILFILLISSSNKILGLLAVLFFIIAFNCHNKNNVHAYNYYEGFDSLFGSDSNSSKDKENLKKQIDNIQEKSNNSSQMATTSSSVASSSMTENFYSGREGFGITDRESNMLRGKSSNSIPVFNNSRDQTDDVSPSDKSVFTSSYTSV